MNLIWNKNGIALSIFNVYGARSKEYFMIKHQSFTRWHSVSNTSCENIILELCNSITLPADGQYIELAPSSSISS